MISPDSLVKIIALNKDTHAILNSLPFYVLIIDENHRILFANQATLSDLSLSFNQIVGGYCPKIVHGCDGTIEHCPLEEAVVAGQAVEREFYEQNLNKWFSSAIYPVPANDSDTKTVYLHMVHDITARKIAEIELIKSNEKLHELLESGIQTLSMIVETKDPYTAGHQVNVSKLACAIAQEMNLSIKQTEGIRVGSLLHDIGKIGIPIEILCKPGKITPHEFNIIKTHCQIGHDILKSIDFPWPVAEIVLQHHERLNGCGYPYGLKSAEIMLETRILTVADVIEAMSSHRPYRPAIGIKEALAEISQNSGILYDSEVVAAALRVFAKGFKFTE